MSMFSCILLTLTTSPFCSPFSLVRSFQHPNPNLNLKTYLSQILHDESVLTYALQSPHSPAATIIRSKDAKVILNPPLNHPVEAVWTTAAARVALVNGFTGPHTHQSSVCICEPMLREARATASHRVAETVFALTTKSSRCYRHAITHPVVFNVSEISGWPFHVHFVLDVNTSFVATVFVYMALPAPEYLALFSFLDEVSDSPLVQFYRVLFGPQPRFLLTSKRCLHVGQEYFQQFRTFQVLAWLPGILGLRIAFPFY